MCFLVQWDSQRVTQFNSPHPPPLDKMAGIFQTTFSNAFSCKKSFVFWFEFQWSLFLRIQLITFQHWFRKWLGTDQATSHYLNQCWPSSLTHICGTSGGWGGGGGVKLGCHLVFNLIIAYDHFTLWNRRIRRITTISQQCIKIKQIWPGWFQDLWMVIVVLCCPISNNCN